MTKTVRTLLATLALGLSATAHADYVLSYQATNFTFHVVDNNTFTLRIQNALDASGDWASATQLDNLAFKDLGSLAGLTGVTVTGPGNWSYSSNELNASGCNGGGSGGICIDASPSVALTNDMLFSIDLIGAQLAINQDIGPHLKVRFLDSTGKKAGSLFSQNLQYVSDTTACTANCGAGTNANTGNTVPEPTSLALLGAAALAGLSSVRIRRRR